jgi:hypothetical protein
MNNEIKKIIEKNPVALATASKDGKPNVIAVAGVKVKDNNLIITDNFMSQTKKNILTNKSVCLAVWNKEKGYKIIGNAKYFDSGKWLEYVKTMKENKGYAAKGAIIVSVKKIIKLC